MTQNILPPEFQIKETQVTEFEEPNPDVFYPNNAGSSGWSPMPPRLDRQVVMDPSMKYGQDSGSAASQSGADAVADLIRQTGINQINTTRVVDREGGSHVHYQEMTRDQQVSSVHGMQLSGDPETVGQALRASDLGTERAPTVEAYQAREAMNRMTEGMNEGTKLAYLEMIRNKGAEAIESVSSGIHEALGTRVIKSTDSGVPFHAELQGNSPAAIELREIMRYHGERQRKGAARPAAKYHPSQSGYRSSNGTIAGLGSDLSLNAFASAGTSKLSSAVTQSNPTQQFTPTATVASVYQQAGSAIANMIEVGGEEDKLVAATGVPASAPKATSFSLLPKMSSDQLQSLMNKEDQPGTGSDAFVKTSLAPKRTTVLPASPGVSPDAGSPDWDEIGPIDPTTPGTGDSDSSTWVGQDGLSYAVQPETSGMSKKMKIGLAVAAGVGLILLLK